VKNGFATLADKVFIGDFDFNEGTIEILKASTGKWSKCIYPYDNMGKPIPLDFFKENQEAYLHLLDNVEKLSKGRDIEGDQYWYLFGRTQALKDVSKMKYAINTIINKTRYLSVITNQMDMSFCPLYVIVHPFRIIWEHVPQIRGKVISYSCFISMLIVKS
jgi:hypothetical protein